jgi:hypothetical protein
LESRLSSAIVKTDLTHRIFTSASRIPRNIGSGFVRITVFTLALQFAQDCWDSNKIRKRAINQCPTYRVNHGECSLIANGAVQGALGSRTARPQSPFSGIVRLGALYLLGQPLLNKYRLSKYNFSSLDAKGLERIHRLSLTEIKGLLTTQAPQWILAEPRFVTQRRPIGHPNLQHLTLSWEQWQLSFILLQSSAKIPTCAQGQQPLKQRSRSTIFVVLVPDMWVRLPPTM